MHRLTLRAWLALLLIASLSLPAVTWAQEEDDTNDDEPKRVKVLGSRISRIDIEGPSPVIRITREDLDASGFSTVGDALRNLPQNNGSTLSPEGAGNSFTPALTSFNFRGLGNNNVLVLINGRRAAPYASPGFNGFQTIVDLNSMPSSAIESIEILKDGASALYGSDAVAGVIDIQLRKDFEGLTLQTSIGDTTDTDSFMRSAFFVLGTSSAKTSLVVTADWFKRNAIADRDRDFSSTTDQSSTGRDIGGRNWSSSRPYPARAAIPDPDDPNFGAWRTFPAPTADPTLDGLVPLDPANFVGTYNYLQDTWMLPEVENYGFYTHGTYQFTNTLEGFLEVSLRRNQVIQRAAPTPLVSTSEQGDAPGGGLILPAVNPFNPWGTSRTDGNTPQDVTVFNWRMVGTGFRQPDIIADTPRMLMGLRGEIGFDWEWEAGLLFTSNEVSDKAPGYVSDFLVQQALQGVDLNQDGEITRDEYANPFGPSSDEIIDFMSGSAPVRDYFEIVSFDFEANGDLFEVPAGVVGLAAGMEYREEVLDASSNLLRDSRNLSGGGESTPIEGDRDVLAIFAETYVPVLPNLDLQLALRYEDYSDFGNTTKPKIGVAYRPIEELLLRASYSESFTAPNLAFLYSGPSTSFSNQQIPDPKRPNDTQSQIKGIGGGNPLLQPEETNSFYAGFVFEPGEDLFGGVLDGFAVNFDYFLFERENLLTRPSHTFVVQNEDSLPQLFPDGSVTVVRDPPLPGETVGRINFITIPWVNGATQEYEGVDFGISYEKETEDLGRFTANLEATYMMRWEQGGTDFAGTYLLPEWRGVISLGWRRGDWAANLYTTYIGPHDENFIGFGPPTFDTVLEDINEEWNFNPQVAYSGFGDITITLGVRDVLDSDPPVSLSDDKAYVDGMYTGEGRFWYLRVRKDF